METVQQTPEEKALNAEVGEIISANMQSTEPPSNAKKIIKSIIITVLLVSAGSAFAYNIFLIKPERIINKMMGNFVYLNSMNFEVSISADTTRAVTKYTKEIDPVTKRLKTTQSDVKSVVDVKIIGATDLSDSKNIKSKMEMTSTSRDGEDLFGLNLEARTIGQVYYFKLNELKLPVSYEALAGGFIDQFKGQWLKLDFEQLTKDAQGSVSPAEQIAPPKLTDEQVTKIKEAFSKADLLTPTEKLGVKLLNNNLVYHYKFNFNKKGVRSLADEIIQISLTKEQKEDIEKSGQDIKSMTAEFETFNWPSGEIWIGVLDKVARKVVLNPDPSMMDAKGTVEIEFLLKDYNKPVQIDTPENPRSLNDLINTIFGASLKVQEGGSKNNTKIPKK